MECLDWRTPTWVLVLFVTFASVPLSRGLTDPRDVYAINQLYASLGSPPFLDWVPVGGDPCGPPSWQGVECVISSIVGIDLVGANLGGELTDDALGSFASIMHINLTNNHIRGSIPSNMPITLRNLSLSDNQFTGPIPDAVSSLSQLIYLLLNSNQLSGPIPDAFEQLTSLANMDLSGNSLAGELPSSMGNLSALTTLYMQNNQLSGMLDVLQDLPLIDLNIENNLFSGPIPAKLLTISIFRSVGNPFNTTILPSLPTSTPPISPSEPPVTHSAPGVHGPSAAASFPEPRRKLKRTPITKTTWFAVVLITVFGALLFLLCLFIMKCTTRKAFKRHEIKTLGVVRDTHTWDQSPQSSFYQAWKGPQAASNEVRPAPGGSQRKVTFLKPREDQSIDITGSDTYNLPPGPVRFPLLPAERTVADHIFTSLSPNGLNKTSKTVNAAKLYTIASLQQYTNSFSQDNLLGKGTLGTVYRAQIPDGTVLAVKKLDKATSVHLNDGDFLDVVSSISKLRHPNIVELVGYCLEHGQRLLVYNYCGNGTLNEALHLNDEIKEKLSWNARMRLALQAAKALEYLHETSQSPMMHRNFKSTNLLLEYDLSLRVSDCGLAPLMPPNSITELQGSGYGGPELELGNYSYQSDVYSFGVVMLELLAGRKSHDRFRPRGEQYLVRWALSKLHDIDALSRMVDPSLNGAYPSKSLSRLADIISLCIQPEPEFRPPMSEIVQKLVHMINTERSLSSSRRIRSGK